MILQPGFDASSNEIPLSLGKLDSIGKEFERSKQLAIKEAVQLAYVEMKNKHDLLIEHFKSKNKIRKEAEKLEQKCRDTVSAKEKDDKDRAVRKIHKEQHAAEIKKERDRQEANLKRLREEVKELRSLNDGHDEQLARLKKKHKNNLNSLVAAGSCMLGSPEVEDNLRSLVDER